MRRIPRTIKVMLAIVTVMAATSAGTALALAGHVPIGGYDRGGYEFSALDAGYAKFGGYDRGGYEF